MYFGSIGNFFTELRPSSSIRAAHRVLIRESIESMGDATCWEIEERLGIAHQTASARICELRKAGVIEDTGRKRLTNYKTPARVYKVKVAHGSS